VGLPEDQPAEVFCLHNKEALTRQGKMIDLREASPAVAEDHVVGNFCTVAA